MAGVRHVEAHARKESMLRWEVRRGCCTSEEELFRIAEGLKLKTTTIITSESKSKCVCA
jgi:hypothetical protein